jgi:hypothetical protein
MFHQKIFTLYLKWRWNLNRKHTMYKTNIVASTWFLKLEARSRSDKILRLLLVHARATWSRGGWLELAGWRDPRRGRGPGRGRMTSGRTGTGWSQADGLVPGRRECPLDARSGGEATWLGIQIEVGGAKAQDPPWTPWRTDLCKRTSELPHLAASLDHIHLQGGPLNLSGHRPWTPWTPVHALLVSREEDVVGRLAGAFGRCGGKCGVARCEAQGRRTGVVDGAVGQSTADELLGRIRGRWGSGAGVCGSWWEREGVCGRGAKVSSLGWVRRREKKKAVTASQLTALVCSVYMWDGEFYIVWSNGWFGVHSYIRE